MLPPLILLLSLALCIPRSPFLHHSMASVVCLLYESLDHSVELMLCLWWVLAIVTTKELLRESLVTGRW